MKKISYVFLCLTMLFLVSCTSSQGDKEVLVTTNPIYNLVKYIAQDKVSIYKLSSFDGHNGEFTPEDMKHLEDSSIILYNGLSLDDKVLDTIKDKDKFLRVTDGANLIKNGEGAYDPHVWLSLNEFKVMGKNVLNALINLDKENEEFYKKNYSDLEKRCDDIYSTYLNDFKNLVNKEFISNHDSYSYLSRDFSLNNNSLYDINNHGELKTKDIEFIIDIVKTKNIKLIVGDKFDSNKELKLIESETGINYKEVNNLEKEGDYFTEYEKLLSSIYDGLR